MVKAATKQFR